MALSVGTNSYASVADADTYFDTRIDNANWANAATALKEDALVTATQIIDNHPWIGNAVSSSQALAWPRKNTTHYDPRLGLETKFTESETPSAVKTAVYEQALHLLDNEDLLQEKVQTFESISVGSVSLSDSNNDTGKTSILPARVLRPIRHLIRRGHTGMTGATWWRSN